MIETDNSALQPILQATMAAGFTREEIVKAVEAMKMGDEIRFEKTAKPRLESMYSRVPCWLRSADVMAHRDYFVDEAVEPMLGCVAEGKARKDNKKSALLRVEGNNLYHEKQLDWATLKYNDGIIWASHDSPDLGMGYANISAVLYSHEQADHALVAIALAKRYHYPEQLMPKLLKREVNCRRMIRCGISATYPTTGCCTEINVEVNKKVPFLAEGISMKVLPGYGRSLVAERDFNAGDVILDEELVACAINPESKRGLCHYCSASSIGNAPITCLHCASVVFCSKKCHDAGMKAFHRFECGIAERLDHVSYGATRIAIRMFFHGLNLFNDNVEQMMEFCKAHGRTGINPLELDYTVEDPFRAFRVFHQTIVPESKLNCDLSRLQAALYYSLLIRQPNVQAVIITQAQKDFLLLTLREYIRAANFLAPYHVDRMTAQLYTVAALCNHACGAPNTYAVSCDGRLKFVLLRPVRKNEQLFTSYTISFEGLDFSSCHLSAPFPGLCICPTCKPSSARLANGDAKPPIDREHLSELVRLEKAQPDLKSRVDAARTFMQQYGHLHPDYKIFDKFIHTYRNLLTAAFNDFVRENRRLKAKQRLLDEC